MEIKGIGVSRRFPGFKSDCFGFIRFDLEYAENHQNQQSIDSKRV